MSNPSAEDLTRILAEARKEVSDVSAADKELDTLQQELAEKRGEADTLIRDVIAELRFFLRHEDESSQRRIMRKYGAIFRSEQEEQIAQ